MTFSRTEPDAVWIDGYSPSQADWESLDAKQRAAVNGASGGAWAPSTPLSLTNFQVGGPTLVAYGGELRTTGGRFKLPGTGVDGYPRFGATHPLRNRKLHASLVPRVSGPSADWMLDSSTMSVRSVACAVQSNGVLTNTPRLRCDVRVHDGATLADVLFTFRVPASRDTSPVTMPKFRVVRMDLDGLLVPLKSTTADAGGIAADAFGWASPAKAKTAAEWANGGAAQTFAYVCDQNNVIDVSAYAYFVEIIEEQSTSVAVPPYRLDGSLVREKKLACRLATAATLSGAPTGALAIDGTTVATGDRILVKDQPVATAYLNGIWIANSGGAWTRAKDFDEPGDITPGCFVEITAGNTLAGTLWEVAEPRPLQVGAVAGDSWPILFAALNPRGNTYHSAVLAFVAIGDMRPA